MKIVMLFLLAAAAYASPVHNPQAALIGVLKDVRDGPIEANYHYELETENKIRLDESGAPGSEGQSNKQGSFSYESPEGVIVQVSYVADENGFQPSGDFIHEVPAHALEQIKIGEQQRAQGIKFDEQGFRI